MSSVSPLFFSSLLSRARSFWRPLPLRASIIHGPLSFFSLSLSTEALKVCVRAAAFCICLASDKRVLSLSRNNADIYPGRMKKNGRRNGRLLRNMLHTHLSVHSAPSYSHLKTLSSYFLRDKKLLYFSPTASHTKLQQMSQSRYFSPR